jgi:hypothetical protein
MKTKTILPVLPLRLSAILVLLMVVVMAAEAGNSPKSFYGGSIKLNPECKIKRMSNGEVIVFAKDKEGLDVKHQFTDFYADLIMAAFRKQRIEYIVDTFSKKYYLSDDDCRREVKHAVNVLSEWNILYREDQIAAR